MKTLPQWLADVLACPRDRAPLVPHGQVLACPDGHEYPVVDGVPIMRVDELAPTHTSCATNSSPGRAHEDSNGPPASDAVGIGRGIADGRTGGIDDFVQHEIVKTNGLLYRSLKGSLPRYPIPEIPLPPSNGNTLVDVGSNWGRWTLSAARKGYQAVGLDPSLDAVLAAGRVAESLGLQTWYVVGDARRLPFADASFSVGHSYGVFQHFSKDHARQAIAELGRVTEHGGTVLLQMANKFGLRQAYNHAMATLRGNDDMFRVRYWTPSELVETFESLVGPCELSADGYFCLNPQASDLDMLPARYAAIVRASEALRRLSARRQFDVLTKVADSVYLRCVDNGQVRPTLG